MPVMAAGIFLPCTVFTKSYSGRRTEPPGFSENKEIWTVALLSASAVAIRINLWRKTGIL